MQLHMPRVFMGYTYVIFCMHPLDLVGCVPRRRFPMRLVAEVEIARATDRSQNTVNTSLYSVQNCVRLCHMGTYCMNKQLVMK